MDLRKPMRREGILSRQVGDEWMLYDAEKGAAHIINASAEFVWSNCDGTNSIGDIKRRMHEAFQVQEEIEVMEDIKNIIATFDELEVLV